MLNTLTSQLGTYISNVKLLLCLCFLLYCCYSLFMSNSVTLWTPADQAYLSFTISQSLLKLMSIESVMGFNHLILCYPFVLLPSTLPNIRVFSNELVLHIRWLKYWSFNCSSSNGYPGFISFKKNWFDLQRTPKSLLQSVQFSSVTQSLPTLCDPMN